MKIDIDELMEYLIVTNQVDKVFGLKEKDDQDEKENDEDKKKK